MKLLLFSDLHCDREAAEAIVAAADGCDVVVGAGDFASVRRNLLVTIDVLRSIQVPAIVVPGNNESYDELSQACSAWPSARVLHGSSTVVDDQVFYGIGAGVPVTPFGSWSFDLTEEAAAGLLAQCPENAVLVSHSPPRGAVDVSSRGISLGSTAVRSVIETKRPRLVVCGHIHESGGQQATIGETVVINAGPQGVVWELSA